MVILQRGSQQQNAARIGRSAEKLVAAWLLLRHDVWVSEMADASSLDMLVQKGNDAQRLVRLQIKATFLRKGKTAVDLRKSSGAKYTVAEVDFVVAVDLERAVFWVLPIALAGKFTGIQLDKRYSGYAYDWYDQHPVFAR